MMAMNVQFDEVFEHVMMNAIIAGCNGNGIQDGLEVSERGAGANMSVDVAAGNAWIDDTKYTESSTVNLTISAADATYDRKDLVTYDSNTSNPIVTTGTPAATPEPPDIPSGNILLAIVDVAAGVTQITNADIIDCRIEIAAPAQMNPLISLIGKGSYVGNSTENRHIAHGLGRVPKAIFFAEVGANGAWTRSIYGTSFMEFLNADTGNNYGVNSSDETYFYVGYSGAYYATANDTGHTYYWVAIG